MIVAGLMSGTSGDGINVAVVEISGLPASLASGQPADITVKLLGHTAHPFPARVRKSILSAMNANKARVADLARLNFLLGELYADAARATANKLKIKLELIGCHGQTLYHQGETAPFLGRKVAVTWQTGEGAVLAGRTGVPVISDFRPADMAAGGKGAPLVPFLDFLLYRDALIGRVVQNIGGIANLTAIPAGASSQQLIAFDTGPGNMVIDAVTERLFRKPYDRDGRIAARGEVIEPVVAAILRQPFFQRDPPKTAGREQFGREFVSNFLRRCGRARKENVVATATALTARSIGGALHRLVLPRGSFAEFVVSGGGAKNPMLMRMLAAELAAMRLRVRSSDEFGIPAEAKEAVAFAVLAYQTWHRTPSNVPSATGASRPAILGKISYA